MKLDFNFNFDFNHWKAKRLFLTFPKSRRAIYLQLAKMQDNHVPIIDAIKKLKQIAQESDKKHPHAIMFAEWEHVLNNGHQLSRAMKGWAPGDELLLISAGEGSGMLANAFRNASSNLEGKSAIRGALVNALAYPMMLFASTIALAWFFSDSVIPSFDSILAADKWTGQAALTMTVSGMVRSTLVYFLIGCVALLALLAYSMRNWHGRGRATADNFFPWSVYRTMNGVSFMSSLSSMIAAGTPLQDAITKIETQMRDNPYMKSRVSAILRHVRNGSDVGKAMKETGYNFPDRDIINQLRIYGEYSGFDSALISIANEWRNDSVESIKGKAGMAFILSLFLMTGALGFFASGLYAISNQVTASTKVSTR